MDDEIKRTLCDFLDLYDCDFCPIGETDKSVSNCELELHKLWESGKITIAIAKNPEGLDDAERAE